MIPRRHLPSLSALAAFEAAVRLGSATAAAAELALTQGAVSRQVIALEAQLGVTLFRREGRRLVPTPAARDYAEEVRRALKAIADASLALRANPSGGTLRLAILPAFGMHWLAPRLARFAAAHPEVTVNLSTRLRPVDFAAEGFDAAIHYGRDDLPGTAFLHLMDEEVVAVAAPGLARRPPARAEDVLALPLLQLEGRSGDWGRWLAHHGLPGQRPPAMLFDQFATMAQAAVHGLGAALLPTFLAAADLAAGRLVPLFGAATPAAGSYWLAWPAARPERAPLASFRHWLAGEVAAAGAAAPAAH